ncbi:hypothetical protein DTO166G4_3739 [Paecilomyces variotii]|nr:hypothetical protein DTO164E3_5011 [Paecilomyces variotii]KAJ9214683.1 hypothetical protein DTO166G4_3739 [Paecilomyces variotii]KAJ9224265.1 hypothetical protein DTO169C6_3370 [Paecilomyces variotii]KAJ9232570.1 hypothetical protein DTO166G5_6166 [Paecilomyces variotii]KAJ9256380.1 hypothetical protein DTO212C5_9032 [Paecilomyces variotii]
MQSHRRDKVSLEAALDEERREILELLEGRRSSKQSSSTKKDARTTPTAVVRSMLDVSPDAPPPRCGSTTAGAGGTALSGRRLSLPKRSFSGVPSPPSPLRTSRSATDSPTASEAASSDTALTQRRASDGTDHIPSPRRKVIGDKRGLDLRDYKFDMQSSIPNQEQSKRASQGGPTGGTEPGRPSSRLSTVSIPRLDRSASPISRTPSQSSLNLAPPTGKLVTDNGKLIDMDRAYTRLSDTALAGSSGSLSNLARGSVESVSEDGDVRLEKDYIEGGENGSGTIDTSEEEIDDTSSGEDDPGTHRGRRRSRKKLTDSSTASEHSEGEGNGVVAGSAEPKTLLEAAEEERQKVESANKDKSPSRSDSSKSSMSAAEKSSSKKGGVHPRTSFDYTASTVNTPYGSDDEADLSDIKQAQNLSIHLSTIDTSVPNRAIRTVIRGDFTRLQQEANEGKRRQRKYLVATDLSDESVYALEWTIGTILRDGDTLFAVYAVDEEVGTGKDAELGAGVQSVQIGEGAKAMQDSAAIVGSQTEKTAISAATSFLPHVLAARLGTSESRSGSVDTRGLSKAELERIHAVEKISQTCIKLLRKTMLQVRVAVEVIHCKSPKHMITEAIDGLEPTLVVLGSRGRSALKGVLLGSFSNYLVAKSSVPVMVARKKLRKHAKYKNTHIRLSNNLTTPRKLAFAKVD